MHTENIALTWLDEHHELSFNELIELSGLSQQELQHLVEVGVLVPNNTNTVNNINNNTADSTWIFNSDCLVSIRSLSRLKQDFELDSNALSLMLVFLERIRTLESQLHHLNIHNFSHSKY